MRLQKKSNNFTKIQNFTIELDRKSVKICLFPEFRLFISIFLKFSTRQEIFKFSFFSLIFLVFFSCFFSSSKLVLCNFNGFVKIHSLESVSKQLSKDFSEFLKSNFRRFTYKATTTLLKNL